MKLKRNREILIRIGVASFVLFLIVTVAGQAQAQDQQTQDQALRAKYAKMAPLDQYLIADRAAEIALARTAAPEGISRDAEVMVLGRQGYETAVKGTNGFTCIVERAWTASEDDPEYWNPRPRAPICFNPAATKTYLPLTIKKTQWALAGDSEAQIFAKVKAAYASGELPQQAPGAMCYMMSKQQYLGDRFGSWRPHLMFFLPPTSAMTWGADVPGSPVMMTQDAPEQMTIFMIPLGKWSDGTSARAM
jgi:hypothetical protein